MKMMLWIILFLTGLYHDVSSECTARGRFPNGITEDCRGYTTCIATTSSSFYQYNLACPPQFIYNHIDSQCTNATSYRCLPSFNCMTLGNVPYENSSDCMSYVACIQGLDGLTARLVDCPMSTVFNPNDATCIEDTAYMCPSATTDTVITEPNIPPQNVTDPTPAPNSSCFIPVFSLTSLVYVCISVFLS